MAENILHDFHKHLSGGLTMVPGSGGIFEVRFGRRLIFSKERLNRFPEEGEVEATLEKLLAS